MFNLKTFSVMKNISRFAFAAVSMLLFGACGREDEHVMRFKPERVYLGADGGTFITEMSNTPTSVDTVLILDENGQRIYKPVYKDDGICTIEELGGKKLSVTVYPSIEKRNIAIRSYSPQGACHIYQNYNDE